MVGLLAGTKPFLLKLLRGIDNRLTELAGPIRVLIVVRNEIGFVNQAPLLRELLKYPDILVHTTSDGDGDGFAFSDKDLQKLYDAHEIPQTRATYQKWHYVVATDVLNLYFRRDAILVSIGHGCSFGNGYRKEDWRTFEIVQQDTHLVFGMSNALRQYVEEHYPGSFNPAYRLFFPTGFPKLDSLYNGDYSRKETLASLDLPLGRKTILVASHWGEHCMLRTWGKALAEALQPLNDRYNIIITAHPKLWELPESDGFSPGRLWDDLRTIEAQCDNIRIVKSGNPQHLLNAADLLISGNSSIRVEYALLDRPALLYIAPGQNFACQEVQKLYREASYCFTSPDMLPDLALKALKNPDLLSQEKQRLKDYFHANPGKAAAAMADIIRKIGRVSSPGSPRWKVAQALSQDMQQG